MSIVILLRRCDGELSDSGLLLLCVVLGRCVVMCATTRDIILCKSVNVRFRPASTEA